jgi:hypothetical protein
VKITEAMKLMEEYQSCPDCGNANVGNGEGKLEITEDKFSRECKCGCKVVITDTHVHIQGKNHGSIKQR